MGGSFKYLPYFATLVAEFLEYQLKSRDRSNSITIASLPTYYSVMIPPFDAIMILATQSLQP